MTEGLKKSFKKLTVLETAKLACLRQDGEALEVDRTRRVISLAIDGGVHQLKQLLDRLKDDASWSITSAQEKYFII